MTHWNWSHLPNFILFEKAKKRPDKYIIKKNTHGYRTVVGEEIFVQWCLSLSDPLSLSSQCWIVACSLILGQQADLLQRVVESFRYQIWSTLSGASFTGITAQCVAHRFPTKYFTANTTATVYPTCGSQGTLGWIQQMCLQQHICSEKCSYSLVRAKAPASAQQLAIHLLAWLHLDLCPCVHLCHQWYSDNSMLLFIGWASS